MVECDLAKVEVAGSNPVSRSIFFWRHSQVVRQRSAKPPFSGSNPDAASTLGSSHPAPLLIGSICILPPTGACGLHLRTRHSCFLRNWDYIQANLQPSISSKNYGSFEKIKTAIERPVCHAKAGSGCHVPSGAALCQPGGVCGR